MPDSTRRGPSRATAGARASAETAAPQLPEWDLGDLYPGMESAELAGDLERVEREATEYETRWKGRLAEEAAKGAHGRLGEAVAEFDALEDLIGRIGSYAGLLYAGDTSDPARAKLYGDVQEKLTDASAKLLFFTLEMNLIDDTAVDAALDADPVFGRYRPWVLDLRKGVREGGGGDGEGA
jgi:oligoendopeptidase F